MRAFPSHGHIKLTAKQEMGRSLPGWMRFVMVFVVLQVLTYLFLVQIDAAVPVAINSDRVTSSTQSLQTGYSMENGEFIATLRMDEIGSITQLYATAEGFLRYAVANFLMLITLAPLKMMALERMWRAFRGQEPHPDGSLRWYTNPALVGKAILVDIVVVIGGALLIMAASLPGWAGLMFAYVRASASGATGLLSLLSLISMFLMVLGILLSYYLVTRLIPLSYCLAAQPEYPLGKVFQRGFASTKGYSSGFFAFRLTLLPWYFISSFTFGAADLYVFPYVSFASFQYLQEIAVDKQKNSRTSGVQVAPEVE